MKCDLCEGKGKIRIPNDEETFNSNIDKYSEFLSMGEAVEKAYDEVGYSWEICPECEEKNVDFELNLDFAKEGDTGGFTCPDCGRTFKSSDADAGNGFCWECAPNH